MSLDIDNQLLDILPLGKMTPFYWKDENTSQLLFSKHDSSIMLEGIFINSLSSNYKP